MRSFLLLFVIAATVRAQALPPKLREAMARVDGRRYNVVPKPATGDDRLTGFDRLQRSYPGQRSAKTDARLPIPLIIQGAGIPWVPGSGNHLERRGDTRPEDLAAIATTFTAQYSDLLGVTNDDLVLDRATLAHFGTNNRYWSLRLHQVVRPAEGDIVPVREAHVFFRVNHGNLIQFGNYLATRPRGLSFAGVIGRADAVQKALALTDDLAHVAVDDAAIDLGQTDRSLEVVLVNDVGGTIGHQLVRAFTLTGDDYAAEVWLDAHSGEVVNVIDRMEAVDGTVRGGVYPNGNTAGTEVLRPLPFITVHNNGMTKTADASGVYDYDPPGSTAMALLAGPYLTIDDKCGVLSSVLSSVPPGDLNFSGGAGTDCANPGVAGTGNTHAGRTAFYHLNLIKEKARKYLDADPQTALPWLSQNLIAHVNKTDDKCNAYWTGIGINVYRFTAAGPGGYDCANSGEVAAIFLHEFGHGLDQKAGGATLETGSHEAFGDVMAFLQTHDSCIGRGFTPGHVCQDGCTTCTGVRDVNLPSKMTPSNITTGPVKCTDPHLSYTGMLIPRGCSPIGAGVMGYEPHCESQIASGAVWDMAQAFIAKYGDGAGWALADRLWYESVYDTQSAYELATGGTCDLTATVDGCGPDNWYTVMLAVDDDNGDLNDGTPDADIIWNAFDGHGIACGATPLPVFSTCSAPATPTLTANPGASKVDLIWNSIPTASSYRIYRNEIDCGYGYTPVAEVTGIPQWTDNTVANGVTYYYRVQAIGSSDTCVSGFSSCQTATPLSPLPASNIYMVLDESGSMAGTTTNGSETKIESLHDAGLMVVDLVDDYAADGFRLGAISFSSGVTGDSGLKDLSFVAQKNALDTFINNLHPTASTAIGKGINGALAAFPASPNPKVVMLLSDGIQNVPPNLGVKMPPPGATVGNNPLPPDVQFYTVALGETIQHDLFDDLAWNGGIPGFYYSGGTDDIKTNFAFWVAGVLGLDPGAPFPPAPPPPPGGMRLMSMSMPSDTHYHVNKSARRITFLVSWAAKGNDLHFEIETPAGTIHPPASSFHAAQGYAEYTVRLPLRGERGPLDFVGDWVVKVTNNPQQLSFSTYALFDDPVLDLRYKTGGDDPVAGQPLPLEARVFENGTPISGLTVRATLDGPSQGVGEALSVSKVSPAAPGADPGRDADRKLDALLRLDPNVFGHAANTVTLIESDPGVYRAELSAAQTAAAGTYVVNFSVAGHGVVNGSFERTQRFSRYLRLKPEIANTNVLVDSSGGGVHLTFTPRDRNDLRLGPGWGDYVRVTTSSGRIGRIVDNLDGSYSTTIEGASAEPRITVTVRGETIVAR